MREPTAPGSGPGPPAAGSLRSRPAFRRLWLSRAVSTFGDSLTVVALLVHIAEGSGTAFAVAALLLVGDFAPALLGPLTGVISDRFDLRSVMIASELVQAATVAIIVVTLPPLPLLLACVAVGAVAAQIFQPASRAAVPALVPDDQLERANTALGFGANGMDALGPLGAAVLVPLVGIRGTLLVDVVTFLASALLLALLPPLPKHTAHPREAGVLAEARAGFRYVLRTPVIRALVLGFTAVVAFNGVDDVALVFLGRGPLQADNGAVALLYAGAGIGLVAGYALLPRRGECLSLVALALLGFAASSAGNLLTGLAGGVGIAFLLQLVRGIGLSAIDVGVSTHLQRSVPTHLLGRVFGNLYGGVGVAAGASYLLGAVLLEVTGPRTTFVVAGAGGLVVTAATFTATRRHEQ
jgi:MFS family permease